MNTAHRLPDAAITVAIVSSDRVPPAKPQPYRAITETSVLWVLASSRGAASHLAQQLSSSFVLKIETPTHDQQRAWVVFLEEHELAHLFNSNFLVMHGSEHEIAISLLALGLAPSAASAAPEHIATVLTTPETEGKTHMLDDMIEGYRDGFTDDPIDSARDRMSNRSACYSHGWLNGRNDRIGRPRASAATLRSQAEEARREDRVA